MTVSANPTPDLQRDQLLDAAIRITGILPEDEEPSQKMLRLAATHLNLELQSLQSEGVVLSTIERTTQAFTAATAEYTLATDTIDVELGQGDVIGTVKDTSGTVETMVTAMSRGEYLQLAVKANQGRPSRCYVEKGTSSVKLIFWPVPDSTMATFQFTRVRLVRAGDSGAVTMDLVRTWSQFLVYAVASAVAMMSSLFDRASFLRGKADSLLERCKAGDTQHGTIQLRVGHNAQNW